ncbi:MAG TPA: DNA polymerase [Planctomycetota bacterium]
MASPPQLDSGRLALDDDTFKDMARSVPAVQPIQQLRSTLNGLKNFELPVGADGRNRCLLSAFASVTGRNQPSTTKFVFGLPAYLRGLIKPPPGYALAYLDYGRQEFGIGAALSGDGTMATAYQSGDPYIEIGKMGGLLPRTATAESHPAERDLLKTVVLGVQYLMTEFGLAPRIGKSVLEARHMLDMLHRIFRKFFRWSDAVADHAFNFGTLQTVLGWTLHITDATKPRTTRNFLMQGNGAEMLRIACCLGIERGVEICAPVHDAVLIQARFEEIDIKVATMKAAMREASEFVLAGFPLVTDDKIIRYPERYGDKRGKVMWPLITNLLRECEGRHGSR